MIRLTKIPTIFDASPHFDGVPFTRLADVLRTIRPADLARIVIRERRSRQLGAAEGYDVLRVPVGRTGREAVEQERQQPGPYRLRLPPTIASAQEVRL